MERRRCLVRSDDDEEGEDEDDTHDGDDGDDEEDHDWFGGGDNWSGV